MVNVHAHLVLRVLSARIQSAIVLKIHVLKELIVQIMLQPSQLYVILAQLDTPEMDENASVCICLLFLPYESENYCKMFGAFHLTKSCTDETNASNSIRNY